MESVVMMRCWWISEGVLWRLKWLQPFPLEIKEMEKQREEEDRASKNGYNLLVGMTIGMGCVHVGRKSFCTHTYLLYIPLGFLFFFIFSPCLGFTFQFSKSILIQETGYQFRIIVYFSALSVWISYKIVITKNMWDTMWWYPKKARRRYYDW